MDVYSIDQPCSYISIPDKTSVHYLVFAILFLANIVCVDTRMKDGTTGYSNPEPYQYCATIPVCHLSAY